MARNGVVMYITALACTEKKYNLKKNPPLDSGTTIKDSIVFFRISMYKELHVKKGEDTTINEEGNKYDDFANDDDNAQRKSDLKLQLRVLVIITIIQLERVMELHKVIMQIITVMK